MDAKKTAPTAEEIKFAMRHRIPVMYDGVMYAYITSYNCKVSCPDAEGFRRLYSEVVLKDMKANSYLAVPPEKITILKPVVAY